MSSCIDTESGLPVTWIIFSLNIASLVMAFKKRVVLYCVLTLYFIFLVVGQAFQIGADLAHRESISYAYAFMTQAGFRHACWFLLAASVLSFLLVAVADGYQQDASLPGFKTFAPPRFFYLFLFLLLTAIAAMLVFVVIGLSTFLSSSRPGSEGGSTIFLTLLGLGVYPLLLKIIYRSRLVPGDFACAAIPLIVSMGCSRMHVILYVTTILVALYYHKGWADRRFTVRGIGILIAVGSFAFFLFMAVGALRDAQNYTTGGIGELWEYNLQHPERNLLSTDGMYQQSVEGMSGLAGAFTKAEAQSDRVKHDYGVSLIVEGFIQAMPGAIKERLSGLNDLAGADHWYGDSIVPAGIETAFTSFGLAGALIYPMIFFAYGWVFSLFVVRTALSPALKICGFMLLGCSIFLVRGSLQACIGNSIAYVVTILASAPLWHRWILPTELSDAHKVSGDWAEASIAG